MAVGAESQSKLFAHDIDHIKFDLGGGMPLLLPPRIIQAQKGVAGARSVVQIVASPSDMTESLSLQIVRNDSHCLLLSFTYKSERLAFLTAVEEDQYRDVLEGWHVSLEAMTAVHETLTFEPKTFAITIRFNAKLGHQAEVRKFETLDLTVWLVPFEHMEGTAPRLC